MAGPKNGVLSDQTPWIPPKAEEPAKKLKLSDWQKLGKSRRYKDIDSYIATRIEYHRLFLPDGTAIKDVNDEATLMLHYKAAAIVIDELENLRMMIQK